MKNLELLKFHSQLIKVELDKINDDISNIDEELKNGCFPRFQYDIPELELKIVWDSNNKRLAVSHYNDDFKILITEKVEIRKKIHPYLDKFIVSLIEFACGIQNPQLKIHKE